MSSTVQKLKNQNLINPPKWLPNAVQYEVIMGSLAYGVSNDNSDMDIYGFGIPHKDMVFPHLAGQIQGFGKQSEKFEQWQQHHIMSLDGKQEYDFSIYNIVKYFQLCMDNNPNMIDSLFVPQRCILHSTTIGNMVRDNRKLFLHKGSWHKFKGYAYSQMQKMENKALKQFVDFCGNNALDYREINLEFVNKELRADGAKVISHNLSLNELIELKRILEQCTQNGVMSKRLDSVAEHGYDVKFAYHILRLINEVEQILTEGDLDLERCREQLKSVRRGEWTIEEIKMWFAEREKSLGNLYNESKLQHSPDEGAIRELLMNCLEEYFGSLDKCVINPNKATQALKDIQTIIERSNI